MTKFDKLSSTFFVTQLVKYLAGGPTQTWLLPIIILAFGLRLYRLDVQSLWFDEIVIVALAQAPYN